jgi:hypothetical protein
MKLPWYSRQKFEVALVAGLGGLVAVAHIARAQTWTAGSPPSTNYNVPKALAISADGIKLAAVMGPSGYFIYSIPPPWLCLSTNAGATWAPANAPGQYWTSVASSADGTRLVAAAQPYANNYFNVAGGIFTSLDSGATWAPTSAPTNVTWTSVASSADGSKLVAVSQSNGDTNGDNLGSIYTSQDSGTTWLQTSAPSNHWMRVACSGDGTKVFAVPEGRDVIYRSLDSGATWAQATLPSNESVAIAVSAAGDRLVVASQMIYLSGDTGATWTSAELSTNNWVALASSADGTKLAAASQEQIYRSTNSGATWTPSSAPTNVLWQSVASSADGSIVVGAAFHASNPYSYWGGTVGALSTANLSSFPPAPSLSIDMSGAFPALSWLVPSTPFVVQQKSALSVNWIDSTALPTLNPTNLHDEVALPQFPLSPQYFYRLKQQ